MHSLHLHSVVLPSRADTGKPNSHIGEPRISSSFLHYSLPPENIFSDALLSLRICTESEDSKTGSCLHARILKLGLESDVFVGNSLLNMYSKCEQLKDAQNLFDHMPLRTIVSWTSMMSAYHRKGFADEAISLFLRMLELEYLQPNEFALSVLLQACAWKGYVNLVQAIHCHAIKSRHISDNFLQNSLIDGYAKSGMLTTAEKLLQGQYCRDVISWTSVISGCISHGNAERALALFHGMQEDGVLPNDVAMLIVLEACSEINNCKIMQCIHGYILKGNWCGSGLVLNSLMEMYSTNGYFTEAMIVFRHFFFGNDGLYPSPETMANLLQGCGNCGSLKLGAELHGYLVKHGFLPHIIAENSLMNMYAESGDEDSAFLLFRTMAKRDVISWNTIIKCFVKNDNPVGALGLLREIHREGSQDNISPDFVTLLTSLEACSDLALLLQGQVMHGYLTKTGLLGDIFVQNALIDMYAKSGRLEFAEKIFKEMHGRDIGSWNSIILAYGINGKGTSAIKLLTDLERLETTEPDAITFVNVLSACAHAGLVEEGLGVFNSMETHYGLSPVMEHFACIVDLLGRAGRIKEAENFIDKMPMKPGPDVWGALLSACVLVGNMATSEKAAKELAVLEPSSSIWRVALSNVYAAYKKWDKVVEMRAELRKEGGWSSVNVEGCEFSFMAGDTKHPESTAIYGILADLRNHMKDAIQPAVGWS